MKKRARLIILVIFIFSAILLVRYCYNKYIYFRNQINLNSDRYGNIESNLKALLIKEKKDCRVNELIGLNAYLSSKIIELEEVNYEYCQSNRTLSTWGANNITDTHATLNGAYINSFNPDELFFMYGSDPTELTNKADVEAAKSQNSSIYNVTSAIINLSPGQNYYFRLCARTSSIVQYGEIRQLQTTASKSPEVSTLGATFISNSGLTINGAVSGTTLPTFYEFEYGDSPNSLRKSHKEKALPPARSAHFASNFKYGIYPWAHLFGPTRLLRLSDNELALAVQTRHKDPNHNDGIGGVQVITGLQSADANPGGVALGNNGAADFRDAEIQVKYRGRQWEQDGSNVGLLVQSYLDRLVPGAPNNISWQVAPWLLTSSPLPYASLLDEQWHEKTFILENNSEKMSFCGANHEQDNWRRYCYQGLDKSLRNHNANLLFLKLLDGLEARSKGWLDLSRVSIDYRNYSLLNSSPGTVLKGWPMDSLDDPFLIIDGWRNGQGRSWASGLNPKAPREFVFTFPAPVSVTNIKFHQNLEWPVKDVELHVVTTSSDAPMTRKLSMPYPQPWLRDQSTLFIDEPVNATDVVSIKIKLCSGYKKLRWGLGELEVFGSGPGYRPEIEPANLNADITGLTPGSTVYYRLSARNKAGAAHGEIRSVTLPVSRKPRLTLQRVEPAGPGAVLVWVRLNSMGLRTNAYVEYGPAPDKMIKSGDKYCGLMEVGRHASFYIDNLTPGKKYEFRVTAKNSQGSTRSEPIAFTVN